MIEFKKDLHVGIDPSLRSTGICIYNSKNDTYFFYVFSEKCKTKNPFRYYKKNKFWIEVTLYDKDEYTFENYEIARDIYNNIFSFITPESIKSFFIEGYSMGSHGMVFDIAEFVGSLKGLLYRNSISFNTVSPMTVKKGNRGEGKSQKRRNI